MKAYMSDREARCCEPLGRGDGPCYRNVSLARIEAHTIVAAVESGCWIVENLRPRDKYHTNSLQPAERLALAESLRRFVEGA
jgi:hypothetical protein